MIDNRKHVWVVTYFDPKYGEPTVTVFDNESAAEDYYSYLSKKETDSIDWVCMDECPLYSRFIADKEYDALYGH